MICHFDVASVMVYGWLSFSASRSQLKEAHLTVRYGKCSIARAVAAGGDPTPIPSENGMQLRHLAYFMSS
jgi:hypothetical protein